MNKQEAWEAGYKTGYSISKDVYTDNRDTDELWDRVWEAEEYSRKFTPFKLFASGLDKSECYGELWESYHAGVGKGILKFIDEHEFCDEEEEEELREAYYVRQGFDNDAPFNYEG